MPRAEGGRHLMDIQEIARAYATFILSAAHLTNNNWAGCIDDYNRLAPHSALGMRSPAEYRV